MHDQLAGPRRTVWWTRDDARPGRTAVVPDPVVVTATGADDDRMLDDLAAALAREQRALLAAPGSGEPDLLPDVPPAPWRGVGPYGQGGTGMTGGVPYGRPVADRAPDRDALELDQLPLRVGPYFPPFPAGLVLDVRLQGDVVQEALVSAVPRATAPDPVFTTALTQPVAIAAVEIARARTHLCWLAHALHVHGLDPLAARALRLALRLVRPGTDLAAIGVVLRTLDRQITRSGVLRWSTRGVAPLAAAAVTGLGPVARASGADDDARTTEPAYRALGFTPIVQPVTRSPAAGGAAARWRQRLDETAQSVALAARAGDARAWGQGTVEGPHGRSTAADRPEERLAALLPTLLVGLDWGDAVTAVVSLGFGPGGATGSVAPWSARQMVLDALRQSEEDGMGSMPAMHGGHDMGSMHGMPGM